MILLRRCLLWLLVLSAMAAAQNERELIMAQWAPSGERVAMIVDGPSGRELWVLAPQGEIFKRGLKSSDTMLVGWTPLGAVVLDEGDGIVRLLAPEPGGREYTIRLPGAAVPLAANDNEAFYLSVDSRHLLSTDREGQTRVVTELPQGMRAPAALSPDGRSLAMRRAQRTQSGWDTQIWVVETGGARQVARVPASYVSVAWHPTDPALLLNYPSGEHSWDSMVVQLGTRPQVETRKGLVSPAQWDRAGRLYTADHTGVWSGGKALQKWGEGKKLNLWAVSPDGERVLVSWQTEQNRAPAYLLELGPGNRAPINVLKE